MTRLSLSRGLCALIDDDDFAAVSALKWSAKPARSQRENYYAWGKVNGRNVYLHRFIMQPNAGQVIDHVNGNGLDNRRENLRVTDLRGNSIRTCARQNLTGFRGLTRDWRGGRFVYRGCTERSGETYRTARFETPLEAAFARDALMVRIHGPMATLNFPCILEREA